MLQRIGLIYLLEKRAQGAMKVLQSEESKDPHWMQSVAELSDEVEPGWAQRAYRPARFRGDYNIVRPMPQQPLTEGIYMGRGRYGTPVESSGLKGWINKTRSNFDSVKKHLDKEEGLEYGLHIHKIPLSQVPPDYRPAPPKLPPIKAMPNLISQANPSAVKRAGLGGAGAHAQTEIAPGPKFRPAPPIPEAEHPPTPWGGWPNKDIEALWGRLPDGRKAKNPFPAPPMGLAPGPGALPAGGGNLFKLVNPLAKPEPLNPFPDKANPFGKHWDGSRAKGLGLNPDGTEVSAQPLYYNQWGILSPPLNPDYIPKPRIPTSKEFPIIPQ